MCGDNRAQAVSAWGSLVEKEKEVKCSYRNRGKGGRAGSGLDCVVLGSPFPFPGHLENKEAGLGELYYIFISLAILIPHALGKRGEELTRSGKVMPLPHIAKLWITIRPRTHSNPWELQVIGREFFHPCTVQWPCTLAPRPWPTHAQQCRKWPLHFICLSVQRRQRQQ